MPVRTGKAPRPTRAQYATTADKRRALPRRESRLSQAWSQESNVILQRSQYVSVLVAKDRRLHGFFFALNQFRQWPIAGQPPPDTISVLFGKVAHRARFGAVDAAPLLGRRLMASVHLKQNASV